MSSNIKLSKFRTENAEKRETHIARAVIRPAQSKDLEQLNALMFCLHDFHHNNASEDIKTATEIEQDKSIARYLDDPECLVYVAESEGDIVGFITGHFCELVSVVSKPIQMGSVDELFVVESFRNQDIAGKLIDRMEQTFEDYGVKKVFVEVWHFNQSAVSFYKKKGFQHHIHWLCKSLSQ